MKKTIQAIRSKLPRRRRRFWRYVSPRRHGLAVMTLALLVTIVYAYWYQTNDRRIRRKAEQYLRDLSGWRAKIHKANFRLFGGIELHDVRLYMPEAKTPKPFFRAQKVLMRHKPWSLLVTGRVRPTEIVCIQPVVRLEYQVESEAHDLRELFALARKRAKPLRGPWNTKRLPIIRVREGRLVVLDVDGRRTEQVGEVPLEVFIRPGPSDSYSIRFGESARPGQKAMQGNITVNLVTGEVTQMTGVLPLERLDKTLLRKYRRWCERYELKGNIRAHRAAGDEGSGKILEAELVDVSMKLPPEEGSVDLLDVRGRLIFTAEGVKLEGISGRIPQAGNARFEMAGEYRGYDPTAPYELSLRFQEMTIPKDLGATGALAEVLENIRRTYDPDGPMNVSVVVRRDAGGKTDYEGQIEPRGMNLLYKHFPYRIEDIQGEIAFRPGRLELRELTARRGKAKFVIDGHVRIEQGRRLYDVTVKATDLPFDRELREALPEKFLSFWDALRPAGRSSAIVNVHRGQDDEHQNVHVHLAFNGQASIEYKGFPYRLEGLKGDAYISGGNVTIESVEGRRGDVRCTVEGTLDGLGTGAPVVDLTVTGGGVPLDETLAKAAGKGGQAALKAIRPKGLAKHFEAHVTKAGSEPLDYRVAATLEDVTFNLKRFPYEVNKTAGVVILRPDRAIIETLRGVHGKTSVSASGQVYLSLDEVGLDVQVDATNVRLDKQFHDALPVHLREVWADLSPSGRGDMSLALQQNLPDRQDDYEFVLQAKGMEITYREFRYPLRGIRGQITAKPGVVLLEELHCESGDMRGTLQGVFRTTGGEEQADLTLSAINVPIDAELLQAMPEELSPLTRRFEPGGTCDLDLQKLRFSRSKAQSPATAPATRPDKPRRATRWEIAGSGTLHDAAVNLGFGKKIITGKVSGRARRDKKGLDLAAKIKLDKVSVGKHQMTDLIATLGKAPTSSVIKLENLEAKAHGGRLDGFAEVELREPLRYGISLTVDSVKLEELFYPEGRKPPEGEPKVVGELDGVIQLTETAGKIDSRRAEGVLRISEARLYKLPVLLDLLTVVYLALPGESAFTEGVFLYELKGDRLVFREINLHGPRLSLVGSGSMSMKTQKLKLTFLTSPLGRLPRLKNNLAEELLRGIFREIMEIEVTGTLAKPTTRTKALSSLEDAVRKLLQPGGDEE